MPLPLCPTLPLYLIHAETLQRPFSRDEVQAVLDNTPYWTFCWAGGQALAAYILRHPDRVAGKSVLDFGCGSGVVAVAAALAGAACVTAHDIDPDALLATEANAALNQVAVTASATLDAHSSFDLIIAADVLYDRDNYHLLQHFLGRATEVWVADSRASVLNVEPYQPFAAIVSLTWPALGDEAQTKAITLYRAAGWRAPGASAHLYPSQQIS